MIRFCAGVLLFTLSFLASPAPAQLLGDDTAGSMPAFPQGRRPTLEEFMPLPEAGDLPSLQRAHNFAYALITVMGSDRMSAGALGDKTPAPLRALADANLRRFVFNEPTLLQWRSDIEGVRQKLIGGDLAAARESLLALRSKIYDAMLQGEKIFGYAANRYAVEMGCEQRARFFVANHLLPQEDPEERSQLKQIDARIENADFDGADDRAHDLLLHQRERMKVLLNSLQASKRTDVDLQPRQTPCPETSASEPRPKPAVDIERSRSTDDYYPAMSRDQWHEGAVAVRVQLDAKGCALQIGLASHSGYDDLDVAALKFAEEGAIYHPMQGENGAQPSTFTFVTRFRLEQ
jgi:TonB family protein